MSLDELIAAGDLEDVAPDVEAAAASRDESRRHLESARSIKASDPQGAYQLAYDAARKAIVASLRRRGLRVRRGDGAHVITGRYARAAIDDALGRRFERMRRARDRSEYGIAHFEANAVDDAIGTAEQILNAVESE